MNKEFIEALEELAKEKHIPVDSLLETIEQAMVSAYNKEYRKGGRDKDKEKEKEVPQNVRVIIDRVDGDITVLQRRDVVEDEDYFDELTQIPLSEAHEIDERYEVGDGIEFAVPTSDFGRIAAQTAKQVVVQQIRERERGMIYDDFITRKGEIMNGVVQRKAGTTYYVSLGKTEGTLAQSEQVPGERFNTRERVKVYILDVKMSNKGPQIFVSRSHPGLVRGLFEQEVPEIHDGIVEIKNIAREAGSRTKMAVFSNDENVDPVGSCVGSRGARVQAVVDELHGEKIDIIFWSDDPVELISNVLSPADVEGVIIESEEEKIATAIVPDYQLSLAIGKQGQNVRLAAKVSGWKIDIKSHTQFYDQPDEPEEVIEDDNAAEETEEKHSGISEAMDKFAEASDDVAEALQEFSKEIAEEE